MAVLLLSLPWPEFARKPIRSALKSTLYTTLRIGSMDVAIVHLLFAVSLFSCAINMMETWRFQDRYSLSKEVGLPDRQALMIKFKAERDAWISAFASTLYILSFQLFGLTRRLIEAGERARAAEADLAVASKPKDD